MTTENCKEMGVLNKITLHDEVKLHCKCTRKVTYAEILESNEKQLLTCYKHDV